LRSIRPGRIRAGSRRSGRLVAATTTTRRKGCTPSSSVCCVCVCWGRGWRLGVRCVPWVGRAVQGGNDMGMVDKRRQGQLPKLLVSSSALWRVRTGQQLAQHALRCLGVLPRPTPPRQRVHLVKEDDGGRWSELCLCLCWCGVVWCKEWVRGSVGRPPFTYSFGLVDLFALLFYECIYIHASKRTYLRRAPS
jgi:hypothetical protein